MLLSQALALPTDGGIISLVGAGGKTSLMLRLARELAQTGGLVAVTTTTHILPPSPGEADVLLTDGRTGRLAAALKPGLVVCFGTPGPNGRLSPPTAAALREAAARTDWLLVEADGSARRPVKAPAKHEPEIFEPSALVIAVAGLSALGQPVGKICHRPELACALLEVTADTRLTPDLLARLIVSERGQFKNVGNAGRFRVLLNQADDASLTALGAETARHILRLLPGCRTAVAALRQDPGLKEVYPC